MSDGSFRVRLARSGREFSVPAETSLLETLQAQGLAVPNSCHQGVCGTCVVRVLEGEPDHWDMYLSPEEQAANDCLCPCVSRSRSELLVLDL